MFEIVEKFENSKKLNDFIINNCVLCLKCHNTYIVLNIVKIQSSWMSDENRYNDRKEMNDKKLAIEYYSKLVKSVE